MRRRPSLLALALLGLGAAAPGASADGGRICDAGQDGALRAALAVAPQPPRAGPVELTVWVQDADSGAPRPEATLEVRLSGPAARGASATAGWCGVGRRGVPERIGPGGAALDAHTRTAAVDVLVPGTLEVDARVREGGSALRLRCRVRVTPALSPLRRYAPELALPLLAVGLYLWRARLLSRRRRPAPSGRPGSASPPRPRS